MIYLDHNATTPLDSGVLDAMFPFLREEFGNPSSGHPFGRRAREAVEAARLGVAGLVGARPHEIVFTSGGTEASHLALLGAAAALEKIPGDTPLFLASFALEHPATLQPLRLLERHGHRLLLVPPDFRGVAEIDVLLRLLEEPGSRPHIVSLMHAHNETGAIQPVEALGAACRRAGSIFHVDAAQSIGKLRVDVTAMSCDLLTIAGHKVYGPKGVGALYVREGVALSPIIAGAGQEHGLRGGTENVAGIVGLGAACRLAGRRLNEGVPERIRVLRDRLWIGLKERIPDIVRTSADAPTLPNTLHVRFPGVTGNAVLAEAPLIAASTGSACHAGSDAPPSAITALGVTESEAVGSVRLSLGVSTTEADVDHARDLLTTAYERARGRNSPVEHR